MRVVQSVGSHVDDLDRSLIAQLRTDGRAPVAKLAQLLGVARGTVQARIDRLVERGEILGFTIRSGEASTAAVRAIMMVAVSGKTTLAVIKALQGVPEFTAMHTTNGAWDLVIEMQTDTLADFDRILRQVRSTHGVTNTETSLLLKSL